MKRFDWRAFISLFILFAFLIIILSGFILYIAPPGRIAKWTSVPLLGLEKDQWQAIHTIFTFLFVIGGVFHVYYNWKILIHHLRNRFTKKYLQRKEVLLSVALLLIIFLFCMMQLPPASTIMAFGDSITDSWESKYENPPVPHTEEMTLRAIAKLANQDPDSVFLRLRSNDLRPNDPDMKLKDLAKESKQSPQQIFDLIQREDYGEKHENRNLSGRGRGRKTMAEICLDEQLNLTKAMENLKSAGIRANENSILKDLALRYNKKPVEIIDLMKNIPNVR